MVYMEKVLNGQGDTHFDFLALSAAETDPDTRTGLLQSFDHLLKKYPNNGQLLFGKALLLQQDGRPDEALTLLEDNSASRHEVAPLLLRSRLLQSMKRSDEALPLLKAGIKEHPDDKRVRLAYARLLVEQNRLDDAKAEFAGLVQQFPDDDDLRFSWRWSAWKPRPGTKPGSTWKNWSSATATSTPPTSTSAASPRNRNTARALDEYTQVGPGNDFLPAQLRQTDVLLKAGRVDEAAQRLDKARSEQPDYAIQLYLIEAEALSNNDQQEKAWQAIQEGLKQYPEDLNLLYTRSMLAEKRNDLAQMERTCASSSPASRTTPWPSTPSATPWPTALPATPRRAS